MSGNEELMNAMKMFRQGVTDLNTRMAVNDARAKLADMNTQVLKEEERLAFANQIGQDLALAMTGAGAAPEQVQAATQGLVPSASNTQTTRAQMEMHAAGQEGENRRADNKNATDLEIAKMRNEVLAGGQDSKLSKFKTARMDKFDARVKSDISAIQNLGSLQEVMNSTDNPMGTNLIRYGLLAAAGAKPISDEEFARADAVPSYREKIARRLEIEITGKERDNVKAFYNKVVNVLGQRAKQRLKKQISGEAAATSELAPEISASEFESALTKRYGAALDESGPQVETDRQYSKSRNQTRIMYNDGTSRVVPGDQRNK